MEKEQRTGERLSALETSMSTLVGQMSHMSGSIDKLSQAVADQAKNAGRTDWRLVLSAVSVSSFMMITLGNMALGPVKSSVENLDTVLQREMRLLDGRMEQKISSLEDELEKHEQIKAHAGQAEDTAKIKERLTVVETKIEERDRN